MQNQTPEHIAQVFARRWLARESAAMRQIFERELTELIREAANKERPAAA
jgi:hypothetical protein